ncbi:MAG: TonB-dependent receptor [Alteromonadaceae bacterium]|nr:TonB-dependent receptor [Alteromonadaceae bacterium]
MSNKFRTGTLAIAIAAALGTTHAYAADNAGVTDQDVEKIVVVGSRAAPRSIADSPVPVDLIGGDELGRSGSSDMLDQIAAAVPSFNVRAQPISDAATLVRPVNLRGLSSDSTLVLVNGKRRHRASVIAFQGGGVNDGAQGPDISVIPSVALKQVEVLRDGAAAQYGSDAIAGVMNFVLKDDADGGSLSVKTGEYYAGDGTSTVVDGNIGMPFTEDGFANFSFQYKNADATSRSVQRPDAAGLAAAGNSAIQDPAQIWGNPEIKDDITVFGNIGLDLGNDKEFYMFGNYSERDVEGGFYYRNPHNRGNVFSVDGGETLLVGDLDGVGQGIECPTVNITSGNVLGQADYGLIADNSTAVGQNCFAFNEMFPGGYTPRFGGNIVDTALAMGTKGEIKGGMFDEALYDLSASVGRNASTFYLRNTVNPSLGPKQPLGNKFQTGSYIQLEKTFNADIVKSVDVGLEEEMSVAGGLEWREESFQIISGDKASWEAGPLANQGFSIGSHGFKGFGPESQGTNTRRSYAAYIDTETYFTDDFMIGAALRYEDFSSFGNTTNFKLTGQYSLTDDFSVRGAISTGFRAPTVGQASVVNTQTSIVNGDLIQTFLAPPTDPLSAFYGGKELNPEKSKSYSFGMVYENNGFFFTADYYNIKVSDRIAQSSQISVLAKDYNALRALGVQNPELISAVTYFSNDFDTTTQGLDIVANYGMELLNGDTQFSLAYNWNDTNVDKFNPATTSLGKVHRLEDGIPHHRGTFTIAQSWENVSAFIRTNYYGTYYATHADDTSDWGSQNASSAITLDAEVSYFVNDSITLSVGASNLLDQKAQRIKDSAYGVLGAKYYESGPFDYNGGYYYVKATYNF